MKKTLLTLWLCCITVICASYSELAAQCTQYNAGPYSDQGIDVAGCDGTFVEAPYQAWANEVYFTGVASGGNYTFELVGCNNTDWGGPPVITAILNPTEPIGPNPAGSPPGNIVGGTTLTPSATSACGITFTATEAGTVYFVVTTATACGGTVTQVDNGFPTVTTNSGAPCGICDDGDCTTGENYCNCEGDCTCDSLLDPVFIFWDPQGGTAGTGGWAGDVTFVADNVFCPISIEERVGVFGEEGYLYLGIGYFGDDCLAGGIFDVEASAGTVVDFALESASSMQEATVNFLKINQDEIDASGGTTDITFTNPDDGGCSVVLTVNWATLGSLNNLVETICPSSNSVCGSNGCEAGENYCNCATDCSCSSLLNPAFIFWDPQGGAAGTGGWVGDAVFIADDIFCPVSIEERVGVFGEEGYLYLGIGYFGGACLSGTTFDIAATNGTVVDFALEDVTSIQEATVHFLKINQDEIDASGGTTDITFINPDDGDCSVVLNVDWAALGGLNNLVETICPPSNAVCGSNGCEAGENYCNCAGDCTCDSLLEPVSIYFDNGFFGGPENTASAVFCAADLGGEEGSIYYGVGFFGSSCLTDAIFELSATDGGTFVQLDAAGLLDITEIGDAGIAFLKIDEQAATGTTTVTFTNPDDANCSVTYDINWDNLLVCDNAIQPNFLAFNAADTIFAESPLNNNVVFCADELDVLEIVGADAEFAYIGLTYFDFTCSTPSVSISTTAGEVVALNDLGELALATELTSSNVAFLKISPAEMAAAGSSTTITYSQGGCTKTQVITWSSIAGAINGCVVSVPQVVASGFGINHIMPVPASSEVMVSFSAPKPAAVQMSVFDITGRTISTQTINANGGNNTVGLNIANYAAGIYYVLLNDGANAVMGKIVKQ